MKKFLSVLLLTSLALTLVGCGGDYSDSLPCSKLAGKAVEQLPVDLGYADHDSEHVDYFFGKGDLFDDHAVKYSILSNDISEIGIFHARDEESAKSLETLVREYLKNELEDNRAFIESYAPKEILKLEEAEVRRFGNYVTFAVLDGDGREKFFDTVQLLLKK